MEARPRTTDTPPRGWPATSWSDASAHDLVEVRDLAVRFGDQPVLALRGIDLSLRRAGRLGVAGEPGSGKTTLLRALIGLLPAGAVASGSLRVDGAELLGAGERAWRQQRGRTVAMVFQDATRALNPTMLLGAQVAEAVRAHGRVHRRALRSSVAELLERVGVDPAQRGRFPHQVSDEVRQRVVLACALGGNPAVLLVDEVAAELSGERRDAFFELVGTLQDEDGFAVVLVTSDLEALRGRTDEIAVLGGGRILEQGPPATVLDSPRVPYSAELTRPVGARRLPAAAERAPRPLRSISPATRFFLGRSMPSGKAARIDPAHPMPVLVGCHFADRCSMALAHCAESPPPLKEYEYGHRWACWNPLGGPTG